MAFGAYDGQSAGFLHLVGELDVGTTTGHVGSNGNGSEHTLFLADIALGNGLLARCLLHGLLIAVGRLLVAEGASVSGYPNLAE